MSPAEKELRSGKIAVTTLDGEGEVEHVAGGVAGPVHAIVAKTSCEDIDPITHLHMVEAARPTDRSRNLERPRKPVAGR